MNDSGPSPGTARTPTSYRFADFEVDLGEETLYRGSEKLNINRRTFQVLRLLILRAGEVVGKQDFFDTVWADTFVEDNSLTVTMTTLRRLLGDSARDPKFIENLPRKGYRFIGKVEPVGTGIGPAAHESAPASSNTARRRWTIGIVAAILLTAGIVGYLFVGSAGTRSGSIDSIAVLPFENTSAESEYMSDGLIEVIINDLSTLPNLRVISRNSAFKFKGRNAGLQDVGRELNVGAVLTGKLAHNGDRISVTTELLEVGSGERIWSRTYDTTGDLFLLRHQISADLTGALRPKLTSTDVRTNSVGRERAEAFQLYLKGRYQWNKRDGDSTVTAAEFFKQSIEKDPTFSLAHVGLANCYLWMNFPTAVTMQERSAMVRAAAQNALEIDPQLGEAYATLAINSHFNDWDWPTADRHYRSALQLAPNYATAHHWYAEFLATTGRFDESFAEYKRALELDPLSAAIKSDLGLNFYYARQPARAIEYLQNLDAAEPNFDRTAIFLAMAYEAEGDYEKAIEWNTKGHERGGGDMARWQVRIDRLMKGLRASGAEGYWREAAEYELDGESPNVWQLAKSYGKLGDLDKGFAMLERLYAVRSPLLVWLRTSPELDPYRSDRRFADLIRRVGIPG